MYCGIGGGAVLAYHLDIMPWARMSGLAVVPFSIGIKAY